MCRAVTHTQTTVCDRQHPTPLPDIGVAPRRPPRFHPQVHRPHFLPDMVDGQLIAGGYVAVPVMNLAGVTAALNFSVVGTGDKDVPPEEAAGLKAPADHAIDGRDLEPLLRGEPQDERPLVWHMPHFWGVHGPGIQPYSAVRSGDLKLLFLQGDERLELYDVVADPGEEQDLAAERPEDVARLARVLAEELERRGAQGPVRRVGDAAPQPARGVLEVLGATR